MYPNAWAQTTVYSDSQKLWDDFNMAAVNYFRILAISSIFWRIRNKKVEINHKNTFRMFKNITIVL